MRPIERSIEEEPVIKKAKKIDNVENSFHKTMTDANEQVHSLDMVEKKETCVASVDGSQNGEVCSIAVLEGENICVASGDGSQNGEVGSIAALEGKVICVASGDVSQNGKVCPIAALEGKDICVELESNEIKVEEVSALSLADRKDIDSKESRDLEMEIKEVDVVSGDDANTEKLPIEEASITLADTSKDEIPVIEKKDSCVASGGIKEESGPNPLVSGKKLLVLDLNGLLADIVSPLANCKADINIGRRAIFKRPFCEDFLKFCFEKFEVGIWSSRKQNNVERITEFLLGDMKSKLLFCWDMSYCATTTVGSLENRHKFVVFKDLNRLWEKHDSKLPWEKGVYNETNTILLDDSPYKALLNPPYTAIFPQSYNHQNKTDSSLGDGGDLRVHLEKLVEAENVQDFIKKNPFGQEAITEASESWDFYKQAIRMLQLTSQTYRFKNLIR